MGFNLDKKYEVPTGGVLSTAGTQEPFKPQVPTIDGPQAVKGYSINIRDYAATESIKKHSHYFKDVSKLKAIDVYRVLALFNVTDQAIGHAIKKLLVAGGRGAGKDINKDISEAIDTLVRWQEIQFENTNV